MKNTPIILIIVLLFISPAFAQNEKHRYPRDSAGIFVRSEAAIDNFNKTALEVENTACKTKRIKADCDYIDKLKDGLDHMSQWEENPLTGFNLRRLRENRALLMAYQDTGHPAFLKAAAEDFIALTESDNVKCEGPDVDIFVHTKKKGSDKDILNSYFIKWTFTSWLAAFGGDRQLLESRNKIFSFPGKASIAKDWFAPCAEITIWAKDEQSGKEGPVLPLTVSKPEHRDVEIP
jgi:hypothetical protein